MVVETETRKSDSFVVPEDKGFYASREPVTNPPAEEQTSSDSDTDSE